MTLYKYEDIASEADGLLLPVTAAELEALQNGQPLVQPQIDKQLQLMLDNQTFRVKQGSSAAIATLGLLPQQYVVVVVVEQAAGGWREAFARG